MFLFSLLLCLQSVAVDDWSNFNFPLQAYASNGPGFKLPFGNCAPNSFNNFTVDPLRCFTGSPFDLGSVFVTQDVDFIAWKLYLPNLTNSSICDPSKIKAINNVTFIIQFDIDNNQLTGCKPDFPPFNINYSGPFCSGFPGSDYRVLLEWDDVDGMVSINVYYYNVSQNLSEPTYFTENLTASENGTYINTSNCNSTPSSFMVAIDKSAFSSIQGMSFEVVSLAVDPGAPLGPFDALGGFSQGDFAPKFDINQSLFDPLFRPLNCDQYSSSSSCINNTNNDPCNWEYDFGKCRPKAQFGGTTGFTCSQFCGECMNSTSCGTNAECQWNAFAPNPRTGINGACFEDPSKSFIMPGRNCDQTCGDCFLLYACNNSKVPDPMGFGGKGCTWIVDTIFDKQWCDYSTFVLPNCGFQNPDRCRNASLCQSAGLIWNYSDNFCFENDTEVCFNAIDDNNNGLVDCADQQDCFTSVNCGGKMDSLSGGFDSVDPMVAMQKQFLGGLAGEPTEIGISSANNIPSGELDIIGLSIADMKKALGFGMTILNFTNMSSFCNQAIGKPGVYHFYLDTDGNLSTGCNETIASSLQRGFEYKLVYQLNGSGNETKKAYRCYANISGGKTFVWGLFPAQFVPPPSPPGNGPLQCQADVNSAILAISKEDIGNPREKIRFTVASTDLANPVSNANDTLNDSYYRVGTIDFTPTDCFTNPTSCGSIFSVMGEGKYMPFQDCFSDSDTDGNGYSGCGDPSCLHFPRCLTDPNRYNASLERKAPSTTSLRVDTFPEFAFINWITDIPSNASLRFYGTSGCSGSFSDEIADNPPFAIDNFRPFHGFPLEGLSLLSGTTYFFKLKGCNEIGDCSLSSCLNFTTKNSSASNRQVQFKFDFVPPDTAYMANTQIVLTLSNGTIINASGSELKNLSNVTTDVNLTFDDPTSPENWAITLVGADFSRALTSNLSSALNVTNTSNSTYVGLTTLGWQEISQNLGVDYIVLTIPQGGDELLKCDEDNVSDCEDVSSYDNVTKISGGMGSDQTVWKLPISLGFSIYTTGIETFNMTFLNLTNSTLTVGTSEYANFTLNLTNNDNQLRNYTITVSTNDSSSTGSVNGSTSRYLVFNPSGSQDSTHTILINISDAVNEHVAVKVTATLSNDSTVVLNSTEDINLTARFIDNVYPTINLTYPANNSRPSNSYFNLTFNVTEVNPASSFCTYNITNGTTHASGTLASDAYLSVSGNSRYYNVAIDQLISINYNATVSCTDLSSQTTTKFHNFTVVDSLSPNITSVSSGDPSTTSATITWTTDEYANSSVNYGTTAGLLTSSSAGSGYAKSHSVSLSDLTAGTTYYFNVTNCDYTNNCNTSAGHSFDTDAASSSSSSSSSSSGGGGGGTATESTSTSKQWDSIAPSSVTSYSITNSLIPVSKVSFTLTSSASQATVTVSALSAKPSSSGDIAASTYPKTFQYLEIKKQNIQDSQLGSASVEFSVTKSWLTTNSFTEGQIKLLRWNNNQWQELSTSKTGSTSTVVNYKATTPGFSYFAIAAKAAPPAQVQETPDTAVAEISTVNESSTVDQAQAGAGTAAEDASATQTDSTGQSSDSAESVKGKSSAMIWVILGIVLTAIAGYAAYWKFYKGKSADNTEQPAEQPAQHEQAAQASTVQPHPSQEHLEAHKQDDSHRHEKKK